MTYQTIRTEVPPVLALEDGRLVIKLIKGDLTMVADVGDGRFFFRQVVDKLIDPALIAAAQKDRDLASPND